MKTILARTALALTVLPGAAIAVATATPASADVLINAMPGSLHLGQSMQAGVWYQQESGGPTGYWAGVWSYPQHKWVLVRSGHATTTWALWRVKPSERGEYATVYDAASGGLDYRTVYYTTVERP